MDQTPCVLVVDDDANDRETLCRLLRDEGYQTTSAENGLDALQKLRDTARPDLILLDLRMPVMDGPSFRAQQLQDPRFVFIPVVVLSAEDSGDARSAVTADEYISKPVKSEELLSTVNLHCRR